MKVLGSFFSPHLTNGTERCAFTVHLVPSMLTCTGSVSSCGALAVQGSGGDRVGRRRLRSRTRWSGRSQHHNHACRRTNRSAGAKEHIEASGKDCNQWRPYRQRRPRSYGKDGGTTALENAWRNPLSHNSGGTCVNQFNPPELSL